MPKKLSTLEKANSELKALKNEKSELAKKERQKLSTLEKTKAKIKELEKKIKQQKQKEKAKYDKSREKYRLRIGKILDECLECQNLDTKAFKEYLELHGQHIKKCCVKK